MNNYLRWLTTVLFTLVLLTGCGGSSGGSDPTDPIDITSGNAIDIVREVFLAKNMVQGGYGKPEIPYFLVDLVFCMNGGTKTDEATEVTYALYYKACDTTLYDTNQEPVEDILLDGYMKVTYTNKINTPWTTDNSWELYATQEVDMQTVVTRVYNDTTLTINQVGTGQFYGSYDKYADHRVEEYTGTQHTYDYNLSGVDGIIVDKAITIPSYTFSTNQFIDSHEIDIDFEMVVTDNVSSTSNSYTVVTEPVFYGSGSAGYLNNPTQGVMTITGPNNTNVKVYANSDGTVTLMINDSVSQLVSWDDIRQGVAGVNNYRF